MTFNRYHSDFVLYNFLTIFFHSCALFAALCWGDVASALYHDVLLSTFTHGTQHKDKAALATLDMSLNSRLNASSGGSSALRMVEGGLRLEPSSDWLWSLAGQVAVQYESSSPQHGQGAGWAVREYCWMRALQLNPKRAANWAALSRMYALHEAGMMMSG
jgi:hypothetical protein